MAIAAAGAAPASASSVQINDAPYNYLAYEADLGETNLVTITLAGGIYTVTDPTADITTGPGCANAPSDPHTATCDATGVMEVVVHLQDFNDRLDLSTPVRSQIEGGTGVDVMLGGQGPDHIRGEGLVPPGSSGVGGPDQIDGREGNDFLVDDDIGFAGAGGNDLLRGGSGDDILFSDVGADTLDGGPGADTLDDGPGNDALNGGDGNDQYYGDEATGNDLIGGDGGNDLIRASSAADGADTLNGGSGDDVVVYNEFDQAAGAIETRATSVAASLDGLSNDGSAGEQDNVSSDVETVIGGLNADTLVGSPGAETFDGGEGSDTLQGQAGQDLLQGGAGNDSLDGGSGADSFRGGLGTDAASFADRTTGVSVTLDDVPNDGEPGEGDDVRTDVENVTGGGGPDDLTGSAASNSLDGGSGEDYVDGGGGEDALAGGAAADTLRLRDGLPEPGISCGSEIDFVIADPGEPTQPDCEIVDDVLTDNPSLASTVAVQPGATTLGLQLPAAHRLVPLFDHVNIPVGSLIDTTAGEVKLTSSLSTAKRQSGSFAGALFQVLQTRAAPRGLTELRLKGASFNNCRAAARAAPRSRTAQRRRRLSNRVVRALEGDARGRFRTRGRHSAATVRGTNWIVADRCDGTLTRVRRGRVAVRDFRRRRTVVLRAGKRYLARAQR